ncbi:MAG TPA: N-acetylmuramoyl-L-alanine amidase [Burkholderiaceae bacterium]|nr:N-acetylmuramoyl-L-alanine amidase [Burkholderiaceae bacterium]HQR69043.1 N-acetylmuramoyl-L-alanine amidase [Burkholderiaceae bacterium]
MSRKRTEGVRLDRRSLITAAGGTLVLALAPHHIARGATLLGVRVWPARDYTRVTIEHDETLKFNHFIIRETPPLRMVVDVEGIDLTPGFRELVSKVEPNDPYIGLIRVGQNRPKVVRLVIELKEDVKPQVFSLEPVGPYQHRLVMDLYPVNPPDPLMALLREQATPRDSDFGTPQRPAEPDRTAARAPAPPTTRRGEADMQRIVTVAIDPGHGGEDPGAVGKGGTFEKNVTLSIAQRLRELIVADSGMRVALTRDGDYFVPLRTRVAKARAVRADLLVSIHADAWIRPDVRGSSVFALSENGASSSAAAWMARRENEADMIGGINLASHDRQLARVLLDLSTTAQINDSLKLGNSVLRELERVNRLHKARVEQAGFAVLKAPDIPSILVETAFISNPEEEARLRDDSYQEQMARAILVGIKRYFAKNPPLARNPLT